MHFGGIRRPACRAVSTHAWLLIVVYAAHYAIKDISYRVYGICSRLRNDRFSGHFNTQYQRNGRTGENAVYLYNALYITAIRILYGHDGVRSDKVAMQFGSLAAVLVAFSTCRLCPAVARAFASRIVVVFIICPAGGRF